ncbi:hypothetical protein WG922_16140 [Ramlibacter sp. AN1015]|uniref:hypothetical protein n=1 Tax=Ramlibacter sp. AN1015 TaxID=3133428 RepID=UPI0030C1F4A8
MLALLAAPGRLMLWLARQLPRSLLDPLDAWSQQVARRRAERRRARLLATRQAGRS